MENVADERDYTEVELTGVETPGDAPAPDTTPAADVKAPDGESAVKEPGDTAPPKEPEPDAAKPPAPAGKPPEGHVPLQALHEERRARQALQVELDALKADLPAKEPGKNPDELILEDPEGAMRAMMERISTLEGELRRRDLESKINSAVPDFLEKAPKMEGMLRGEGFSEEAITRMIGAVGEDAPTLFKFLAKHVDGPDLAAIEARLTEKITKDLSAKFLSGTPAKNIGNLPGAPPGAKVNVEGESGYAKLSPEDQERYLRGEL